MKFTIGKKIGLGFGVLIILTVISFLFTNKTINNSKDTTDKVVKVVTPSITALDEFHLLLQQSQNLITKWYHVPSPDTFPFKDTLRKLISVKYPEVRKRIETLSTKWTPDEKTEISVIFKSTDELFTHYQTEIMAQLNSFTAYNDANVLFAVRLPFEEIDDKLKNIDTKLSHLTDSEKEHAAISIDKMNESFTFLQFFVRWLGIALVLGGVFTAIFTARSIVKPIAKLKGMLQSMSLGIMPKDKIKKRGDEIGEMGTALEGLVNSMESTTEFANQVGSGNFESHFEPLSKDDTLGHALLKMRVDLRENERVLEQKVIERTEEVVRQKEEIQQKSHELETVYNQVTDSIKYAKRIQQAILPPEALVKKIIPNSFILFKPKDIVSGDFYWMDEKNGKVYFAAVDCTGHGVPGAFMSIVGFNLLKEIISIPEVVTPAEIMNRLKDGVRKTLHHGHLTDNGSEAKDGMDMTLCCIDLKTLELQYAAAFNPLYIVRNGELIQFAADKFPVGVHHGSGETVFKNNVIKLEKGDTVYASSDGYADQFGGPRGKKFMVSHFRDLLVKVSKHPISEQKTVLNQTIEDWRGDLEQVDDILVFGVRV